MVQLTPMTADVFEDFIKISMQDQVEGQVQAGEWRAEDAVRNIEMLRIQFLPDGLATPGHFFFDIKDPDTGAKVGGLWYIIQEEDGKRQFFVMDIQVYEGYKRRGYGSQAFLAMEKNAREMGITGIALHVFKHNTSAREMYEKLGYAGTGTMMSKEINSL
jgi:GNAT superfamily N-acetyltransferase